MMPYSTTHPQPDPDCLGGEGNTSPDKAERFINGLYLTLLNRPGDPTGLEHWTRLMKQGMSQQNVAEAFFLSRERHGILVDS